jgi:hypothetical protein
MYGLLYFLLLALSCAAGIAIGSIATALTRVRRADFVQLKNELRELSQHVTALQAAEQRRFIRELNSRREGRAGDYDTPQGNRTAI